MGTHYSTWQCEMEDLLASAQNIALGSFLFRPGHLVLKRHAFGIVFRKPRLSRVSICEDLEVVAASNLLARIQVSVIGGSIMRTEKRPRPLKSGEAGTANFRGTRDLVPEAQSKIHCECNGSYFEP